MSRLLQPVEVVGPVDGLLAPQVVEVAPVVETGVVAVIEKDLDGVLAHRLDVGDVHVLLVQLQLGTFAPVATHFGRRGVDPQQFRRVGEASAFVEGDLQGVRRGVKGDLGGAGRVTHTVQPPR